MKMKKMNFCFVNRLNLKFTTHKLQSLLITCAKFRFHTVNSYEDMSDKAKNQPFFTFFWPFRTTLKGHIFITINCIKTKFCTCNQQGLKFTCNKFEV